LAESIDREYFHNAFKGCYSDKGRPAKPIRLIVGLLLLKQIENLSDENPVLQWKRNPYYQYFCRDERVGNFALLNAIAPSGEEKGMKQFFSNLMQKGLVSKKGDFI